MYKSIELAKQTIAVEIEALNAMSKRLDDAVVQAMNIVLEMRGRVVVSGMGKSGIIGQKIAATLASTGTPAFFIHPSEAYHGDLGMIKPADVALLISNSGETEEVIRLLPFFKYQKNKVIAMAGTHDSTLTRNADVVLDVAVEKEACINNLAPTSSTTATLVMGDALAVALADVRDFKPEDFAKFHPGGSLGRKLLTKVCDVMHKENIPICSPDASFRDVVHAITCGRLGVVLVKNDNNMIGIISDGDVRRAFDEVSDYKKIKATTIMTKKPKTINVNARLIDAEEIMRVHKINTLIATSLDGDAIGLVQIYD